MSWIAMMVWSLTQSQVFRFEVKWALGNITTNKASGGDKIPVGLFKIPKDDAVKVLHSKCQQSWKTQQLPQDWKTSIFIPISKKGNAKNCCDNHLLSFTLHDSKVMLKILQVSFQQYVNLEFPEVKARFQRGRRTKDELANFFWIVEKAKEFQENICFCFINYTKAFDYVDHMKLWKILKKLGVPGHFISLLRYLYVGQEATVRTKHGIPDCFQNGKGI